MQLDFEKKIDLIERGQQQNIFGDIPLREDASRSQTEISVKSQKSKHSLTPDEEASFFRLEKMVSLRGIIKNDDMDLTESPNNDPIIEWGQ